MSESGIKKIDKYYFNLSNRIGSGSYANVYKGEDKETGKVVAIKMIDRLKIVQEDYLLNGLMQEIQIMKKLDSDYIVKLIDVLETKNNYYIVQEYCDQGDFRHYLKARGTLPEEEAKQVLVQILNGFLELLKHGVIHRDLKPENILISTKNQATGELIFKLADFGFSRTVDNFRRQLLKSLVGTPLYMSPQILMYEKYTSKSDIWSIGLLFYEMVYGRTPWDAQSQYQLVEMIKNQPIQWRGEQEVSENAINFIYKCLQIEEVKRIQWDEIYAHPLFGDYFSHFLEKNKNLEDKALYLINNLRQKVHSTNTDLADLFRHFDLTNDSKLSIKEFEQLMKQIDADLNREEIEYIFNKFDSDGDNKIDFTEFQKWLEKNNVRLSITNSQTNKRKIIDQQLDEELKNLLEKQKISNKHSLKTQSHQTLAVQSSQNKQKLHSKYFSLTSIIPTNPENPQINLQSNINSCDEVQQSERKLTREEKAIFTIGKLGLAIEQYQIDQKELFNRYERSQTDSIFLPEFTKMIKKIDDKLEEDEITLAFQIFDSENQGKISFLQFKQTLENIGNSIIIQIKQLQHKQSRKSLTKNSSSDVLTEKKHSQ